MIGIWSANFHQGQRSCAPRKQAGHMSALTNLPKRQKTSCTAGAVHTWALCFAVVLRSGIRWAAAATRNLPQPLFALGGYVGN
jgi:hypothetical protein